jgi:hypothetical protein
MMQMLKRVFRQSEHGPLEEAPEADFLSESAFEAQLRRERARSERAMSTFVLMHFTVEAPMAPLRKRRAVQALAAAVVKRTREVDITGEYRNGIGLILPYTSEDSVEVIWNDIQEMYAKEFVLNAGEGLPVPTLHCDVVAPLMKVASEVS